MLDGIEKRVVTDVDGVTLGATGGAHDALSRP
jgi:hypothetical protein